MVPTFAIFLGMPGPVEMVVIMCIILLLFGNRLPSVMRSMGKGITEFKKGVKGIEEELDGAEDGRDTARIDGNVKKEPSRN